jgi:hypothetical protein
MLNFKKFIGLAGLLFSMVASVSASASLLTSNLNVDNGYSIYISTDDSQLGTLFGSKEDWYNTYTDSVNLASGVDYFLHVAAYDVGGIAGFLGDFSLSGTDHQFSNGTQSLLTGDSALKLNTVGFGLPYVAATDIGQNGVAQPWSSITSSPGVSSSARWIWSSDQDNDNFIFLSTKISSVTAASVPEPSPLVLLAIGFFGMLVARRKIAIK